MITGQYENPASRFDYVCLHCGRVHQQSLAALVPGGSFTCPFCKSDFHVTGGRIRLKERQKRRPFRDNMHADSPDSTKPRRKQPIV